MKKIGVISDTHGKVLEGGFIKFLNACDEIWHAGDIGNNRVIENLELIKPVKAVYGNIDGPEIRHLWPEYQEFTCESVDVLVKHIGGRPGKYDDSAERLLKTKSPDLFICGHSHILKIQYDEKWDFLFLNPGAAGISGFHKVRTAVRFQIDEEHIKDMEVYETDR
ncbi:MAG: metallophosphoesterase family protein [Bacteroidales bacterium]|nr:metallophosphoesterase family protein [Bacteroidales bacterium]